MNLVAINKQPKFFQTHDEQWLPVLRLAHQCQKTRTSECTRVTARTRIRLCRVLTLFLPLSASLSVLVSADPDLLPTVQVDRGAIKFVLKGADIMAPGLTSAGGSLPADLPAETYVAVLAEGMTQILAIGKTTMSADEMRKVNKGTAITNLHYLNDGLWNTNSID